jgi:hypothetical protein
MLRATRLWNLKHLILKAFSKHPVRGHERCKDEDKALLGDEERYSSTHMCGFKSLWIEPKRCIQTLVK